MIIYQYSIKSFFYYQEELINSITTIYYMIYRLTRKINEIQKKYTSNTF